MLERTVTTELRDNVFFIGLSRPQKRNAFNLPMLRELGDAYTRFENDAEARCAVLFAHGDHFTAGLDLADVGPAIASGQQLFDPAGVDPLGLSGRVRSKPIICAVAGWCITIGIELLLASDIRVTAKNARFRQMEVNRGIMPFGGATLRFPQVAGWGNAMRYLLTGDEFDADEAYRLGIAQHVVDTGAELEVASCLAQSVAKGAPLAVQATLRGARAAASTRSIDLESLMREVRSLLSSEDAAEGLRAFLDRRPPQFTGR